jgi:hypothetical protein
MPCCRAGVGRTGDATMKWLAGQEQICAVVAKIRGRGGDEEDQGELSHSTIRALWRMGGPVGELQSEGRGQSVIRGRQTPLRHPRSHHLRTACLGGSSSARRCAFDYSVGRDGEGVQARVAS